MSAPIALLHGFLGSPDAWAEVVARLRDGAPGRAIVAPFLPGHGPDAAAVPTSWEGVVDAVAAALPVEATYVVGYSMGGRLALGLAARHPRRLLGLCLASAHLGLASDAQRSARRAEDEHLADLAERQGLEALVAVHEVRPVLSSQAALPPEVRSRLAARRRGHDAQRIAAVLRTGGLASMPDLRGPLRALSIPVASMAGEADATYAQLAREVGELSGGQVEIVPGAGHDLVLEAPDRVADAILAMVAAESAS